MGFVWSLLLINPVLAAVAWVAAVPAVVEQLVYAELFRLQIAGYRQVGVDS